MRRCRFCHGELSPGIIDVEHGCDGAEAWHESVRVRVRLGATTYTPDPVLGAWADEKAWSQYPIGRIE